MAVLNVVTASTGLVGVMPRIVYINTDNTTAEVLVTGYLNKAVATGAYQFTNKDMALVYTTDGVQWMEVSITSGNTSLLPAVAPGTVVLPVTANHIASFAGTAGAIGDDATTAINGGNLQAGLSGTAGYLASFPASADKGSLRIAAVANTGDTLVTVSNAAHGQATAYSIPDVGAATGQFNVVTGALTSGHLMSASGTAGKLADSGIAASAVQLSANIKAAQSANIGGAGAGPIDIAVTGATSASVAVATVLSSSNAVSILNVVPGSAKISVTFSGDPGASAIINYVVFIAAQ